MSWFPLTLKINTTKSSIEFEVGLKLGKKFEIVGDEGDLMNHYILPDNNNYFSGVDRLQGDSDTDRTPVVAQAPSLSDLGHDLTSGDWYVIKGTIGRNFYGDTKWVFNPLLARRTGQLELAFVPRPLTIRGSGGLKSVENMPSLEPQDYGLWTDVRVAVRPEDMPLDLVDSFILGSRVYAFNSQAW